MMDSRDALRAFSQQLGSPDVLSQLREGVIGEGVLLDGPFGSHPLIYADYVASGRALRQIETFIGEQVLPYYANTHTQASFCGRYMSRLRLAARAEIARLCGADADYDVIFTGAGATRGINQLVALTGVTEAAKGPERPVVFVGPYEHHSNILPWRESGARIIEIGEGHRGGPDMAHLAECLDETRDVALRVATFSAASNVTGIVADVEGVTRLLNAHDVKAIWDYAGGGPYLPIKMRPGAHAQIDAVVISPHKFIGGPGASGVLIARAGATRASKPSHPGGGTVRFVSPWGHDYAEKLHEREEAGTPNVIGDVRAALVFLVKEAVGQSFIDERLQVLRRCAKQVWANHSAIELLGIATARQYLPIFSFRMRDLARGGYVHQQLVTRMLSDCYGVQARGGCACAGPYAHRLLAIGEDQSLAMRQAILNGNEIEKPGWTRLNFSFLHDDKKAFSIINAVKSLADAPYPRADMYRCDQQNARFEAMIPA